MVALLERQLSETRVQLDAFERLSRQQQRQIRQLQQERSAQLLPQPSCVSLARLRACRRPVLVLSAAQTSRQAAAGCLPCSAVADADARYPPRLCAHPRPRLATAWVGGAAAGRVHAAPSTLTRRRLFSAAPYNARADTRPPRAPARAQTLSRGHGPLTEL